MEHYLYREANRSAGNKFLAFCGTRGSLRHSQELVTSPYPEPDQSSPYPSPLFLKILCNILPSTVGSLSGLLSSGLPTRTLYEALISPLCASCSAHLIFLDLSNPLPSGDFHVKLRGKGLRTPAELTDTT